LILFDTPHSQQGFDFYASKEDIKRAGFPMNNNSFSQESVGKLFEFAKKHERIWLIRSHSLDFHRYSLIIMGKIFRFVKSKFFFGLEIFLYESRKRNSASK